MRKLKAGWHYWKEHSRLRRLFIIVIYLTVTGGLIINYGLLNRQSTGNDDTPLNTYKTFTDSAVSQGVKLTSRVYSPKQERMIATFKVQTATDPATAITSQYLKFKVATVVSQKIKMVVIPVTDNDYVVMVDHLKDNYQAIQFTLVNKAPQVTTDEDSDTKQAPTPVVKFVINNKPAVNRNQVSSLSPKAFAIEVSNSEIKKQQSEIKAEQQKIKDYQTVIDADKDKIRTKQVNRKYEVASQQSATDNDIDSLKDDITQNKGNITTVKHSISTKRAAQELLRTKQQAIRNGTFKLPKVSKSTQMTKK